MRSADADGISVGLMASPSAGPRAFTGSPSDTVLAVASPTRLGAVPGRSQSGQASASGQEHGSPVAADASHVSTRTTDVPPAEDPPAGSEEPLVPEAPGAPTAVACVSGDMTDVVTFEAGSGAVTGYTLYRAPSENGEFVEVQTTGPEALSFAVPIRECARWYYRVATLGPGGSSAFSSAVSNDAVALFAEVPPEGRTLRSSNGEVVLALPAGAYDTTTTVSIDEISGSPVGGIITFAGIYRIEPSGSLQTPATLSISYTLAVTHHQVTDTLLRAAGLLTHDEASGSWVSGATNVRAESGYIVGELSHFSEWTPGSPSPHGTDSEAVGYCSGVCHDLVAGPGSTIRYSTRDPQTCFNCHGNPDTGLPPLCGVGTNVQAEFFAIMGEPAPAGASLHPVTLGGFYCTICHDPHADSSRSPGLLKTWNPLTGTYIQGTGGIAPGTEFCWACHGAVNNRRTAYLVPGYWLNSGGDKKTGFNGAHTGLGAAVWRYDTETELKKGYVGSTVVSAEGTVGLSGSIALPKNASAVSASPAPGYAQPGTDSPGPIYDGNSLTKAHWYAWNLGAAGATEAAPKVGTGTATIDLGAATTVSSFVFNMDAVTGFPAGTWSTDTIEIQTSDDNVVWQTISSLGTVGTRLPDTFTINASDTCRYVRFVFSRRFVSQTHSIGFLEIDISGPSSSGTFEVWPDIARKAAYAGGVLKWSVITPASTSFSVNARASTDRGSTWTAWTPMTNGGAISLIPAGSSLENARLQVRGTLTGAGAAVSPSLDWIQVAMTRGAITGTTPQWSGVSPSNVCLRCHTWHGSANPGLVPTEASSACKNCHSAAYGSTFAGSALFGTSVHASLSCAKCHVGHGKANNSGDSYAYLLRSERTNACLACHLPARDAFEGKQGAASEWAKHDIVSAEQVKTGSTMSCARCHGTHISSTGLVNPDATGSAFTTLRADPTSIPTGEVTIEATKDTLLDSTAGQQTWNYGSSSQMTITSGKRMLVYFDLSAVPAGAVIQNATLLLWGTSGAHTTYTGGFTTYRAGRDWLEGTGMGAANSAGVNGATWLEWRYGDNANTGNSAEGDWSVLGGDYVASPSVARAGLNAVNVTTLVEALRANGNYGLLVKGTDATANLPVYTRENATAQYRPRLRIVYQTGPATAQVVDDISFCTKCHDGSMPAGLSGQSLSSVGAMYAFGAHGAARGLGPESSAFDFYSADRGGGGLKAPYTYGMDSLPCGTCHDPHGSRLPYHLREVINGQSIVPPYGYDWRYDIATQGKALGYVCAACHIFPSNHSGYQTSFDNCSSGCHSHAGK